MPQKIDVSDTTFQRLQALAVPFVDAPGDVIDRLLDHYESVKKIDIPKPYGTAAVGSPNGRTFDPSSPPDLTHTRLMKAVLGGKALPRPKWNELVRQIHRVAYEQLGDFDELRRMSTANMENGNKQDEGYKPLNGLGFSIQGVDSNEAWRIVYGLAKRLGVSLEVEFEWREKEGAAFPGSPGALAWNGRVSQ